MEAQISLGLPKVIDIMKSLLFQPNDPLTDQQVMAAWEADLTLFSHSTLLSEAIALDSLHLRPNLPQSQITNAMKTSSITNSISDTSQPTLNDRIQLLESLKVIQNKIQQSLENRVNQMTFKPRLYRVAQRLSLASKEIRSLVFIILTCSGVEQPSADERWSHSRSRSELYSCREFSSMDGAQLLHFLSPSRKHFSQGLLEVDEELAALYTEAKFRAPREVLKAMYGCKLTLDEAMTLGNSVLADVLAEEEDAISGADPGIFSTTKPDKVDGINDLASTDLLNDTPSNHQLTTDESAMCELLSELRTEDKNRLEKLDKLQQKLHSKDNSTDLEQDHLNKANGQSSTKQDHTTNDSNPDITISNGDINESMDEESNADIDIQPYENDMEYLKDGFDVVQEACKVYNFRETNSEEDRFTNTKRPVEALQREANAKLRKANNLFKRRLAKTTAVGGFLPRLELLVAKLKLAHFERMVIVTLVGSVLSQSIRKTLRSDPSAYRSGITVAKLLRVHCDGDLGEEIKARSFFYRNATLIRSGIVTIDVPYDMPYSDLGDFCCELDHMVLDYVAGLHTELNEIMDNARCYTPSVDMNSVILPQRIKDLVLQRAENFEVFRRLRKEVGFDDIVRYGKGLTLLFHGKSGTGKTLFANALASHLGKKLLLVDFASSNSSKHSNAEAYRIIFREAKIHGAIVFMDECDELFESRDRGAKGAVTVALREMETFDGIMILATNRPQTLDEAMHRRIALSLMFETPDANLRLEIWKKHVPKNLKLSSDVDLRALAIEFELTGGYIKNAVFQALSHAVGRLQKDRKERTTEEEDNTELLVPLQANDIVITMDELRQACRLQARGDLKRTKLERRILPKSGLDKMVATEDAMQTLKDIVMVEKVRGIMSTRWGFKDRQTRSNCVLIFGPSGCGKSFAASCLGYETGRPLQVIAASELHGSREGVSQIGDVFGQAAVAGAIVVVEHAEQLLFETAEVDNTASPGTELLFHMQSFDGLVVLCCTTAQTSAQAGWPLHVPIPNRVSSLLSYIVLLRPPHRMERLKLWRQLIPDDTPTEDDVPAKLEEIASKYEFTGAKISSSIRRGAAAAAMRRNRAALADPNADINAVKLSTQDLEDACEAEIQLASDADGTAAWVKGLYV